MQDTDVSLCVRVCVRWYTIVPIVLAPCSPQMVLPRRKVYLVIQVKQETPVPPVSLPGGVPGSGSGAGSCGSVTSKARFTKHTSHC